MIIIVGDFGGLISQRAKVSRREQKGHQSFMFLMSHFSKPPASIQGRVKGLWLGSFVADKRRA